MEPAHGSSPPPPAWWRQPADAFWASGISCALGSSLCFALAGTFVKALQNRIPVFEVMRRAGTSVLEGCDCAPRAAAVGPRLAG